MTLKQDDRRGSESEINDIRKRLGSRLSQISVKDRVEIAEKAGRILFENKLSTSQIRNFLQEVSRIRPEDADAPDAIHYLRVPLAYAVGRAGEGGRTEEAARAAHDLFASAIDAVKDSEDVKAFVEFVQAVVAYHRYHGGKNN